ncbi:hypothetical protein B0T17DRAFT_509276 [Bombardia bombarda]|uniref:Uncharacterized protein n=1 Tax=Bombardia bombarda TaxID=252184 RepID=A0AA39WUS3_9PEZI|nr:hypothetical protein B0T17DRAFT_509276 [Bombardia bombarda]
MAAPPPAFERVQGSPEPPSYRQQRDPDPDEILQPTILILDGQLIHAESVGSSPLYQLSRVIYVLSDATNSIKFERLDYRVRTLGDGTPSVSQRGKHLCNLQHYSPLFAAEYECGLEPVSGKGLGSVNIQKRRFPHSGFRAASTPSAEDRERDKNLPKERLLFNIKESHGIYEWSDADGTVVATQQDDNNERGQHLLLVAVPLSRRMMDGLVALWCLWLWHMHASNMRGSKGWKDALMQPVIGLAAGAWSVLNALWRQQRPTATTTGWILELGGLKQTEQRSGAVKAAARLDAKAKCQLRREKKGPLAIKVRILAIKVLGPKEGTATRQSRGFCCLLQGIYCQPTSHFGG